MSTPKAETRNPHTLAPLPVRLAVYALLALAALASIWLIDSRAIARQEQLRDNPHLLERNG